MTATDFKAIWQSKDNANLDETARYNHVRNTVLFSLSNQSGVCYYRLVHEFDRWYGEYNAH